MPSTRRTQGRVTSALSGEVVGMPASHAVLRRLLAPDGDVVARLRAALPDKALGGDRREAGLPPGVTPRHTPWDAYAAGLSTAPTARR